MLKTFQPHSTATNQAIEYQELSFVGWRCDSMFNAFCLEWRKKN